MRWPLHDRESVHSTFYTQSHVRSRHPRTEIKGQTARSLDFLTKHAHWHAGSPDNASSARCGSCVMQYHQGKEGCRKIASADNRIFASPRAIRWLPTLTVLRSWPAYLHDFHHCSSNLHDLLIVGGAAYPSSLSAQVRLPTEQRTHSCPSEEWGS